jgi:hypothetical protein
MNETFGRGKGVRNRYGLRARIGYPGARARKRGRGKVVTRKSCQAPLLSRRTVRGIAPRSSEKEDQWKCETF